MLTADDIIEGENLDVLPPLPDGAFDLIYIDPPFNTGKPQVRRTLEVVAGRRARRASAAAATPRGCWARCPTTTPSTTTSRSCARAWSTRGGCSPSTGRSTSTSTRARRTTSRSCSTSSSAATASSTRSSGPTTTARAPSGAGRPSTTRSSSTSRTRPPTTSTPRRSTASRTWRRACRPPSASRAASRRPTRGGTRSCRRTGARRPAIRRRSPRASCGGWSQASSRPGGWCLDFFAGSGTLGAVCRQLGRRYVLVDRNPEAVRVMRERLGGAGSDVRPLPLAE